MKKQIIHILFATFTTVGLYAEYGAKRYVEKAYIAEQKKIVVVIPSYKNADVIEKNLDSVFMQDYDNFHVIYIDDVSPDGTGDLVQDYIDKHNLSHKITLIRNKHRSLAMANLYRAIMMCDDDDIIATLDGDDWFAHECVLSILNEAYQNPNVWITYGSYTDWPEPEPEVLQHWTESLGGTLGNRPVSQEVIDNNEFRSFIGCTGQLRTFYAWLFKQIKLEDLMYQSKFLPMTYDVGIMVPMHELAGKRHKYISDVIYIHNLNTELNDHKVDSKLQGDLEVFIRNKEKYQPLSESRSGYFDKYKESTADLIIFSFDRPLQLYALLESVDKHITGLNSIQVICRASNDQFVHAYQEIENTFSHVTFFMQNNNLNRNDFKPLTINAMKNGSSNHVLFSVDDIIITNDVNISECIYWLEVTNAHGFYLRLGTHLNYCYSCNTPQAVPEHATLNVKRNILAWQFECSEYDWNYHNTVDLTLYRKEKLISLFETFDFVSPNFLEGDWAQHLPQRTVGLCYEHSKMINIPLNIVTENAFNNAMKLYSTQELLELFENGLKMDITPMYQMTNRAAHVEYEQTLI